MTAKPYLSSSPTTRSNLGRDNLLDEPDKTLTRTAGSDGRYAATMADWPVPDSRHIGTAPTDSSMHADGGWRYAVRPTGPGES
jgi:hypothetical protein